MAKITRAGGLTDISVGVLLPGVAPQVAAVGLDPDDVVEAVLDGREAELLEEDACPGSNSETSPAKPPTSDEPEKASRRKRARTTGSR